ncbi:acyltransferase family protein [Mycobacterium intracellulare]|uniref:Acetyltransferase AtfA n=1 Tax=Mycobacterium intracellulare subsp. chimaera TaxID=222805 RepID=A0A7U5MLT5_MYCIT|nr:acyltransferase [Mycobacterium intracellulare]ASL15901.1 acetyltransferase AtfA [Mycobacterium intracellulare subsp. chimaera]MDM3927011.1 acyltransferase [Mycobacterium intracellulare subsp. chimaera]PBA56157.1 acyltransferase [Mycobacterium intracellulare subsp. chimaera]
MTLGEVFDPRKNALNAWRLTLAIGVVLWHSFPLTGRMPFAVFVQLLGLGCVDGFFAISGYLIVSSWLRNPKVLPYFMARCLRILPGLWICLIITAFVVAPIGVAIQGDSAAKLLLSSESVYYVLKNSAVWMFQYDIAGTPRGIPVSGMWNGSIWTLGWEGLCYIAVVVLGKVGLLRRRWFIPLALGTALVWSALLPPWAGIHAIGQNAVRFAIMFSAGMFLHQFQNVIPARWSWVICCTIVVLVSSAVLPNYRLVAALPLAYAIVVSGALIKNKGFRLSTDLSYGVYIYAFAIQQLLVICGLATTNPIGFCLISAGITLPIAALSWFLVEKPALTLKVRLKARSADRHRSASGSVDSGRPNKIGGVGDVGILGQQTDS